MLSASQIRSRITVVCAEVCRDYFFHDLFRDLIFIKCKRLKLKCDRRTPCGSCTKRDTVARCIYSPAAAEKVCVYVKYHAPLRPLLFLYPALLFHCIPSCFPQIIIPDSTFSSETSTPSITDSSKSSPRLHISPGLLSHSLLPPPTPPTPTLLRFPTRTHAQTLTAMPTTTTMLSSPSDTPGPHL